MDIKVISISKTVDVITNDRKLESDVYRLTKQGDYFLVEDNPAAPATRHKLQGRWFMLHIDKVDWFIPTQKPATNQK